ncbi:MAG: type II toxin-antitoxin system RelE/ParE family toxin [Planctomycetota bacterium]|jgi:mRNA-degrading endonuclease RelE of RelBE toxin-antitoxin system
MNYRVIYTDSFLEDVGAHIDYMLGEHVSPQDIARWYDRLLKQFDLLDIWPRMFPIDEAFSEEMRQPTHKVNFGDYLAMYQVDDEHRRVELVAFYHGASRKES